MIQTIEPNTALALAFPGHEYWVERPEGGVLTFSTEESAQAWIDHNCPDSTTEEAVHEDTKVVEKLLEMVGIYAGPVSPNTALKYCRQRLAVVSAMNEIVAPRLVDSVWRRAYEILRDNELRPDAGDRAAG